MNTQIKALVVGLASMLSAMGCDLNLDSPTVVKTSRILAIVAEPPSISGGQGTSLDAMISIPQEFARPLQLEWRACTDPMAILAATGIGGGADGVCGGAPVLLSEDESFVIDGETSAQVLLLLESTLSAVGDSANILGSGFSGDLLRTVIESVGVAIPVELRVLDANGQELVAGFKRVALHSSPDPGNTNPPSPAFVVARDPEGEGIQVFQTGRFECGTGDSPIRLSPEDEVELRPTLSGMNDREEWLEIYSVFDFTGGLRNVEEDPFYSWFVTAGSLSEGTTQPPDREVRWRIPRLQELESDPQRDHAIWLVVRDGHLGTSACRLDVEIEGLSDSL